MKQPINEIKRMQQLAGILKEDIDNTSKLSNDSFKNLNDLAMFLDRHISELIENIPELGKIPNLNFKVDYGDTIEGEETVIPTMEFPINNPDIDVFEIAPITFNLEETGGDFWGSDIPITIDGKTFYYGYFNY